MPRAELRGRITLNGNQWQAGLNRAKKQAEAWGAEVTKIIQGHLIAAFSVDGVFRLIRSSLDRFRESLGGAGTLVSQARRADLGSLFPDAGGDQEKLVRSIETLQEFGFALEQFGIQADRASDIFQDISTRRIEALEAFDEGRTNDQTRAFGNLGIGEAHLRALTGPQLVLLLGDLLKGTSESDKIKEAMDALFSDAGVDFLVLLREGLREEMHKARAEGLIATGESILRRDALRRQEAIDERRAEIGINQANERPGGVLSRILRLYQRSFFDVIGNPGDVASGIGAAFLDSSPFNRLQSVQGGSNAVDFLSTNNRTRELERRLEELKVLKGIESNTRKTTENTDVLKR